MTNLSTVTTKKANFKELLPDFKRFALKKSKLREASEAHKILACVEYDGKYLNVTDAHRLLRVNTEYVDGLPEEAPFLYNVHTEETTADPVEVSKYPGTDRLFPDISKATLTISEEALKALRKAVNEVHQETKEISNRVMLFEYNEGVISIQAENDKAEAYSVEDVYAETDGEDEFKLHVNSGYLKNALLTANKLRKLSGSSEIYVKFYGRLRPFEITDERAFRIRVLPIMLF